MCEWLIEIGATWKARNGFGCEHRRRLAVLPHHARGVGVCGGAGGEEEGDLLPAVHSLACAPGE